MILTLCDLALMDWLKAFKEVSSEDLEDMLTLTLNIARGMEHLHSNKVLL